MVRNYKKKVGLAAYFKYDITTKEKALQEINQNRISIRGASEKYGIPYATLNDAKNKRHVLKHGRPTALETNEEKKLVEGLLTCASWGFPLKSTDIKRMVKNYLDNMGKTEKRFKDNQPGAEWFKQFVKRHPELTVRFSENIKRVRAEVSYDTINRYFDELEATLADVPLSNIINYDETNFTDDPGSVKVVVRRGSKHADRIIDSSKTSISVMIAGAANGSMLPPYTVYKSKHIYPTWTEGGLPGAAYNRNTSGWFDSTMFQDWFKTIVLPYVRRFDGPKVLIGDNLSSHVSMEVIKECQEHNIRFVLLPPNSTHLCQPLDVAYFRPVKQKWRKVLEEWKLKNRGVLPKSEFPRLLASTLLAVGFSESENMKSGFKACGIHPFDREAVLNKIPKPQDQNETLHSERSWTTALVTHLQEARVGSSGSTDMPGKTRRGKRFNVPAGKSIVPGDLFGEEMHKEGDEGLNQEVDVPMEELDVPMEELDSPMEELDVPIEDMDEEIEECENLDSGKDLDDGDGADSCTAKDQTTYTKLEKNNFVLVKYPTPKRIRLYVGQIVDFANNDEVVINFLKKHPSVKQSYFTFPDQRDEDFVSKDNILSKLISSKLRRDRYIFPEINDRTDIE